MRGSFIPATFLLLAFSSGGPVKAVMPFPGPDPGAATARLGEGRLVLESAVLAVEWKLSEGRVRLSSLTDRIAGREVHFEAAEAFRVTLAGGKSVAASEFTLRGRPTLERLEPRPDAVRCSEHFAGWEAEVSLSSPDGRLLATWRAALRDGSNYATQRLTLKSQGAPVAVEEVTLLDLDVPGAEVRGVVEGSPVVAGNLFFACEHPMAANRVEDGRVIGSVRCYRPVGPGAPCARSSVIGVAPPGQMRRGFLYYVERERARPYRLFLHYNSWWDIAWPGRKMNEEGCGRVIEIFGRELVKKRGVPIDSFVFDDGWDDPKSLWRFHAGFPQGFGPLREAAEQYGSAVGTWLSPWGGYGQAKADRLAYGKTEGFETNSRGFSLAGPKYYGRFRDVCLDMIRKYGVNYFKFDGIAGGVNAPGAGREFGADVEALLQLCGELRRARADVYLSITTGTWPSPYWLWHGDSVWRNGADCGFHGAGTMRQQWITYRDMIVRGMIVDRAPLYPLNSLMIVSVCYAQLGTAAKMADDVDDLADEIRMAFGGGSQLFELYVTPQKMSPQAWDVLAECAKWSRANADVLVDVHWLGGDPGKGEIYGYAAWSPRKGILVVRNPGDAPGSITFDLASALELPPGAAAEYSVESRWARPGREVGVRLRADQAWTLEMEPFEVRVLEAVAEE